MQRQLHLLLQRQLHLLLQRQLHLLLQRQLHLLPTTRVARRTGWAVFPCWNTM
jgi:hypothetical protein